MSKPTDFPGHLSVAPEEIEPKFRTLLENLGGAIAVAQDNKLVYVNPKVMEISGYSARELTTRPFTDFIHPEDRERVLTQHQRRIREGSGPNTYQYRIRNKRGETVWLQKTVVCIIWNGRPASLYIDHDITEQKRMERALAENEAELRLLVDSSKAAIVSVDPRRRLTRCNPAFLDMFGYSRREVIGQSFAMFHTDEQSFLDFGDHVYPEVRETGVWQGEWDYFTKDGTLLTSETILSAQRDAHGKIAGYTVIMRDVSQRKKAQEEKEALEAQLRQAQKIEAVGTLAGGIAHDFNNILGAVMGFTELALDNATEGKASPEELEQVLAAAARGRDLVKQILTFSRKVEPILKPLDLSQAAANSIKLLERTIPKMISIEKHYEAGLSPVQGDSTQLGQVLMNLVSNAADAMSGGGRLILKTKNIHLDEEYCKGHVEVEPGDYVLLRVSDTGCGMDQQTVTHMFDPFFTTKPVGKGTGLGMSTVFGIVKGHGGHLTCQSHPGLGTTFNIYLPAINPNSEAGAFEAPIPNDYKGGRETILLVDDEDALRQVGELLLSRQGYKVYTAASGEEALDQYRQMAGDIDLVVLDLGMPGMGGAKCLEELVKIDQGVRVIIASGYSKEVQLKELMDSGAAGFVGKPFRQSEVLRMIRDILDLAAISGD